MSIVEEFRNNKIGVTTGLISVVSLIFPISQISQISSGPVELPIFSGVPELVKILIFSFFSASIVNFAMLASLHLCSKNPDPMKSIISFCLIFTSGWMVAFNIFLFLTPIFTQNFQRDFIDGRSESVIFITLFIYACCLIFITVLSAHYAKKLVPQIAERSYNPMLPLLPSREFVNEQNKRFGKGLSFILPAWIGLFAGSFIIT